MANPREIKRRIRSISNIAKVTGALEAVSASKVRRAQAQALASRSYAAASLDILRDLAERHSEVSHPLLEERTAVNSILVILFTSDRGLAGPYNTNIVRKASDFEREQSVPLHYMTIGKKGRDLKLRRGAKIVADFSEMPGTPSILDITAVARAAIDDFLMGAADEVYVAYTEFVNTVVQEPVLERLLPLRPGHNEPETISGMEAIYTFEPDPQSILDEILPRFTELVLFQMMLESLASEHSARMVAMRNATENANALVEDLTLSYNKARQLAITSEMLDIVGGAEALARSGRDARHHS